jgi:hypothetical protein
VILKTLRYDLVADSQSHVRVLRSRSHYEIPRPILRVRQLNQFARTPLNTELDDLADEIDNLPTNQHSDFAPPSGHRIPEARGSPLRVHRVLAPPNLSSKKNVPRTAIDISQPVHSREWVRSKIGFIPDRCDAC